jgi:hypothetical protein
MTINGDGNNLNDVDMAWYLDDKPQKPQSGQLVTQLRFEARHLLKTSLEHYHYINLL